MPTRSGSVIGSTAWTAAPAPVVASSTHGAKIECGFDPLPDILADDGSDPIPGYKSWAQSKINQHVLASINDTAKVLFGGFDQTVDSLTQLDNGLLGIVVDHRLQRFAIVVSSELDLEAIGAQFKTRLPLGSSSGAPVDVVAGCAASAALASTMRELGSGKASTRSYGALLDAAHGKVEVHVNEADKDLERLSAMPLVEIVPDGFSSPRAGTRENDTNPHWGAAGIYGAGGTCTSWATVRLPNGNRGSVTAGHCGENGAHFESRNGVIYYGRAEGRANYPEDDMTRLRGGENGTFEPRLHTDAGSRPVRGSTTADIGDLVCKSGNRTGVQCGVEVQRHDGIICNYDPVPGCNNGLTVANRPGTVVGLGGDSGGPVYRPLGDGGAGLRGMEVNGWADDMLLAERPSRIQTHLGVTVITTTQ